MKASQEKMGKWVKFPRLLNNICTQMKISKEPILIISIEKKMNLF